MILHIPNNDTLDYYKGILDKLGYGGETVHFHTYLLTIDDEKRYFTSNKTGENPPKNISTRRDFNDFYVNNEGQVSDKSLGQKLNGIFIAYKKYKISKGNFKAVVCLIVDNNANHRDQFETDLENLGYSWEKSDYVFSIKTTCHEIQTDILRLTMSNGDVVSVDKKYFDEL